MVDLDTLKRWAERFAPYVADTNEWYRLGDFIDGKDAAELGELFAALVARHVAQPSPDRAALVERMARSIQSTVRKEVTMNVLRQDMLAAEAALAAVEAAGWGPMPEPITDSEQVMLFAQAAGAWVGATNPVDAVDRVVDTVLAALPERHRRLVLGVSGE